MISQKERHFNKIKMSRCKNQHGFARVFRGKDKYGHKLDYHELNFCRHCQIHMLKLHKRCLCCNYQTRSRPNRHRRKD